MTKLWKILLKCSGIVLFVVILWKVDTRSIVQQLSDTNIIAVLPLFFFFLAAIYLKAKRWGILLANSRVNIAGENLFFIYVSSFLPASVTPGRVGEMIRYKLLKNKDLDNDLGLMLSLQDRMWDFALLFFLGSLSLLYIVEKFSTLLFLTPCFFFCVLASIRPEVFIKLSRRIISGIFPHSRLAQMLLTLSERIIQLSLKDILICSVLTVCSWCVYFSQVHLLFRATGNAYSFLFVSCAVATTSVVGMLPISVAGIGTRDVTLVGLFSLSGKSPEAGIILSTCILAIVFANCIISLPFWMYVTNARVVPRSQ
jgi:uncharacterized protein (TIRG00374 family)